MAGSIGSHIVNDGLVLYLDAANSKSYVSGATTWEDLSKNNNDGTLYSGATFNNQGNGNIIFDGTNDYVMVPSSSILEPSNQITLECIFIRNSGRTITSYSNDGGGAQKAYSYEIQTTPLIGRITVTTLQTLVGPTINSNTWYHATMTYDGATFSLYINGLLYTSSSLTGAITYLSSSNLNIGRKNLADGEYINGNVAIERVYNKSLTSAEVLQNFNATKRRFGL